MRAPQVRLVAMVSIMITAAIITVSIQLEQLHNDLQELSRPPVVVTVVCPTGTAMVLASQENVWTCVAASEAG